MRRKPLKTTLATTVLTLIATLSIMLPFASCQMDSVYLDAIEEKLAADQAGLRGYSVTYYANNSTSGTVPNDSSVYLEGATVEVHANTGSLERTNYTFDGWNTREDGAGIRRDPGDTFLMGQADVELYARWAIDTPTVTFEPQGGDTPSPETKQVTYGEAYGTLATTSRAGYAFDGWYDASSGGDEITAA
jgi:uncharacterized repeat protein (TIGR02543 family)